MARRANRRERAGEGEAEPEKAGGKGAERMPEVIGGLPQSTPFAGIPER